MFLESYGQRCNGYCLVFGVGPCNCGSPSRLRRHENDSDKENPRDRRLGFFVLHHQIMGLLRYADFGHRSSRDSSKWD